MDEIVTTAEAAKLRGTDQDTIARWCRAGWLKSARKMGKTWIILKREVMDFKPPKRGPEPKEADSRASGA